MSHELPRTVQTILIGAAEIIRTRGWCRGTMRDVHGAVCLLGAIFEAGMGSQSPALQNNVVGHEHCDTLTSTAWETVERLINADFYSGIGVKQSIPHWNDQPSRTVADVLRILDIAVEIV